MRRTLILAALIVGLWFVWLSAQTRYGASLYIQSSQPVMTTGTTLGALWWNTSNSTLNVLTNTGSNTWTALATGSGSGLPSGMIAFIATGTCPAGFTEVSALNGKLWRGTVAANGNVGTAAGNDSYTPAGTVSAPTISWPAAVPTNGAIGLGTFVNVATATSGNCAATNIAAGTGSTTACKATAPNLAVPAEAHSGSLTAPTIAWPASVPTNSTPAFTGQAATVIPAYVNLIACQAN